jgi:hypothetical protein
MVTDNFYTWPDFDESTDPYVEVEDDKHMTEECLALDQMFNYWETNRNTTKVVKTTN